ncbi:MAG: trpC [Segetibacter sp.]|nr:trpC [Segetibacter sp.]
MISILDKIIVHKKREVEEKMEMVSVSLLESQPFFKRETLSLKASLLDPSKTGIIAEFKRKSPSKGIINPNALPHDVTEGYTKAGASGLSILTDERFFGGTNYDLQSSRFNHIPILRKEFIVNEYQVLEAKAIGADVILLIAACLTPQQVKQFASVAKRLGLEVLLEIHHAIELKHICDEVDLVGVNNRSLKTFEVDIQTSVDLFNQIPADKIRIAESGISNVDSVVSLRKVGYKGFLIGENFMKQPDPAIAFHDFVTSLRTAEQSN